MHISLNGYYIFYPSLPEIKRTNVNLKDIQFPLSLRVCVSEIENSDLRYLNIGYKNDFELFFGKSGYNESLFGWSGHTKDGSIIGEISGLHNFVSLKVLTQFFQNTYLQT